MAGRKPTPTVLHLARNNPGHRTLNKNEPKPVVTDALPPDGFDLSDLAKEQWEHIAQHLLNSGLLTVIDKPALVLYCEACARWMDANDKIRKTGIVVKTPSGFPVQSPYLPIANKAFDQMKSILVEFGMTPSSRSKVAANQALGSKADNPYNDI